ncbi:endonuclease domain-containing protein [Geomonas nitrogeniifigens]|uniref:Endonuclease domain-containing protein n=1 Tax=Geomonas diazotrophica TaxID=2843197 RepID=A0ABX8JM52_9BACT|nr:endonuclease domain-containing protein [Geomonas nitrogeniifigens]QWV99051.1 endonuclease domain-containing protein [Geomonas nitrogeniifigens]QXE88217.1 endonuclease domain-containing protein [Geomonas nitrogeniifigens]
MTQATHAKLPDSVREFARSLREKQTDAESLLWLLVRNRRMGFKFRRQHPVGGYILDFFCHEASLCIELDGGQHADGETAARDEQRTMKLEALGIRVIRFWDDEVLRNTEGVLEKIYLELVNGMERG